MRIIFMGTPDFAVASLAKLVEAGKNIVAVVTSVDKPAGRGLQMHQSAVKKYALEQGITVLQPSNLKSPAFLEELAAYKADLQIVVAFRMLPELVWAMPPLGTFNLHASLLPQYRGAAPINWAIINGEKETGVSTFFLKHEIDTGSIIFQEKIAIGPYDTVGDLYPKLMHLGANLVLKTVDAIAANNYPQIPQPQDISIKHAPKIFKEDCEINWHQPAESILNFVRGLSPYPAAYTNLQGKVCKIFKVSVPATQPEHPLEIGQFMVDKNHLLFKCTDAYVSVEDLQLEGKKRMPVAEFLKGFRA